MLDQDCCFYEIHPLSGNLLQLHHEVNQLVQQLSKNYIWHKDPLQLFVADNHLQGSTRFNEEIDDEWFIVYLLLEITKKFNVIATILDRDQQFLLIEAAEFLPTWLDVECSKNRIYLFQGHLCIISNNLFPVEQVPKIEECKKLFEKNPSILLAKPDIEEAALRKALRFPDHIVKMQHNARMIVPLKVAHLFKDHPWLIAPAVEAFYTRDPFSLKACQKMSHFTPEDPTEIIVKMTKTMYAQLAYQQFYPPKVFGPMDSRKEWMLGMKVTCGLEMMMQGYNDKHQTAERYNFDEDSQWKKFKDKITELGYFQNELEGSALYGKLENMAKLHFVQGKPSAELENPQKVVSEFEKTYEPNHLLFPQVTGNEDSDDWLLIDPKRLDRELENMKLSSLNDLEDDFDYNDKSKQLKRAVGELKSFMYQKSGINGVEGRCSDSDDESVEELEFDEHQLFSTIQTILQTDFVETDSSEILQDMDQELAQTCLNESFEQRDGELDIDFNLAKNILQSFSHDDLLEGPALGLFKTLGVPFEKFLED